MTSPAPADEIFDAPVGWRADVIADFRLRAAERCAAASPSPGFPQLLDSMIVALADGAHGPWLDVGGGLGGAASWIQRTHRRSIIVVDPSHASLRSARRLFPSLPLAAATAGALPIADHSVGAALLSGVVSLIARPRPMLDELARVLSTRAGVAVTDLFAASSTSIRDEPNVFWSIEEFRCIADASGFETTHVAVSDLSTGWWPSAALQVDDEVRRRHHGKPGFERWWADREHLRGVYADGLVQPAGLVFHRAA